MDSGMHGATMEPMGHVGPELKLNIDPSRMGLVRGADGLVAQHFVAADLQQQRHQAIEIRDQR
jgi:hypothetical protein